MSEVKIRILRDHFASPNGFDLQEYKEGEILKTGTPRLTPDLFQWHQANPHFSEILVEEKAVEVAPENKAISSEIIENKSIPAAPVEAEKIEIVAEEAKEKPKEKFFTNPLKRNK